MVNENVPLWLRLPAVAVTVIVLVPGPLTILLQPERPRPNPANTTNAQKKRFHLRRDLKSPPKPNSAKANKVPPSIDP